jgi:hypothetical protein
MEYFLEQIQMLLPVLGLSFALPLPTVTKTQGAQIEPPVYCLKYAGVEAYAREINAEFVVLQNSTARKKDTPSLSDIYKEMRSDLLKDGKLTDSSNAEYWVFTQNVPFTSPSTAANVICGTRLNGRAHWKLKDGRTYAEWEESQAKKLDPKEQDNTMG